MIRTNAGQPPQIGLTPVRGDRVPDVGTAVEPKAAAALKTLGTASLLDLDAFVAARASVRGPSLPPSLQALLKPPSPAAPNDPGTPLRTKFTQLFSELVQVFADGYVTESEIGKLAGAMHNISAILGLKDASALQMLPTDVRNRMEQFVFEPLEQLMGPLTGARNALFDQLQGRDGVALHEKLANPSVNSYRSLPLHDIAAGKASVAGPDRYQVGDFVAVRRSSGDLTLGVVTGKDPDGLRVEVSSDGNLGLRTISAGDLLKENLLRIGDFVELDGKQIWVTGLGKNGSLALCESDANARVQIIDNPAAIVALQQRVLQEVKALRAPAQSPAQEILRAGGAETVAPETMKSRTATGAVITNRGFGYVDYNEDAAALGVLASTHVKSGEVVYAGAFDQAGGMGHSSKTGAASELAAHRLVEAARAIAHGGDPVALLDKAARGAHEDVKGLGVRAATTFAAGVIVDGNAYVANCGDSMVLHYGTEGKIKNQTQSHNLQEELARRSGNPNSGLNYSNVITSCLGGPDDPTIDSYCWPVGKGDTLVFISDGVADGMLGAHKRDVAAGKPWLKGNGEVTADEIGKMVAKSGGSAEKVTTEVVAWALANMENGKGKPDNTTAVAVRVS